LDHLAKIIEVLGSITDENWPSWKSLRHAPNVRFPHNPKNPIIELRTRLPYQTTNTIDLVNRLLTLDPSKRITATKAFNHPYFGEEPKPKAPDMFPTFPSKANEEKRRHLSPAAPIRGTAAELTGEIQMEGGLGLFAGRERQEAGAGFALK